MHLIALVFFYIWVTENTFPRIEHFTNIGCESKHVYFASCANEGNFPGDIDSWVEMSERVQKGGFIIKTVLY